MKKLWKILKIPVLVVALVFLIDTVFVVFFSLYRPDIPKADAIIVLGAAINTPALDNRSLEGLRLYEEGKGDVIVLSGGVDYPRSISEAAYMQKIIRANQKQDVPLILEDKSRDTFENIKNSKTFIPGASSVIIVSDKFHLARAVLIAKRQGFKKVSWSSPRPYYYDIRELSYYYLREMAAMIEYIPRFIKG